MSKILNLLASAQSDENIQITGGLSGDQIGYELNARQWYDTDWYEVFRFNTQEDRDYICNFMYNAILNGCIGYDQTLITGRDTLFDALGGVDFHPELLEDNVECDCSSLVYCALYGLTRVPYDYTQITPSSPHRAPTVSTLDYYIMTQVVGAGYSVTKFTDDAHLHSSDQLLPGDIICNSGHVAVWI